MIIYYDMLVYYDMLYYDMVIYISIQTHCNDDNDDDYWKW